MKSPLRFLLGGLAACCLALIASATPNGTILSNYPVANTTGTVSSIHSASGKAIAFNTGTSPCDLTAVTLHLRIPSLTNLPVVSLYTAAGSQPGSLVATFITPAITAGTSYQDCRFVTPGRLLLEAGTTYYVTLAGTGSSTNAIGWGNGSPTGDNWSGSATFANAVYGSGSNPSGWTGATTSYNWLRIEGDPVSTLLTNYPVTNTAGALSGITSTGGKAIGFTVGDHDHRLTGATLSLKIHALTNLPVVRLYSANGTQPGILLATLTSPTITSAPAVFQDYTFTAPGSLTLKAGTSYYLVALGTGSTSPFYWSSRDPVGAAWSGPAVAGNALFGYNSNPSTWTSPSSVFNWFQLRGAELGNPDAWLTVPVGGGGFVTGIISDSTGADLYIRTDMGGLLKWNAAGSAWTNLTDKIIPTTNPLRSSGLLQTLAVALDPSDSNRLYIAVGGGSVSNAFSGVYHSPDKGATWGEITTGTPNFSINGNGKRTVGERLAIDPNNPNLLWYGTETSGLMKAVKSNGAWTWSQVASTQVPSGTDGVGIAFVVCDKNESTTLTYAGVYDSVGTSGGVYVTGNGTDWTKVGGVAVTRPARAAVANDGTLFVTGSGVVAQMPRNGSLAAITPVAGQNYCALAINADASVICVGNSSTGTSQIWRSTNRGLQWPTQGTLNFNHRNISGQEIPRQEPDGTLAVTGENWFSNLSALWVHPTNPGELWAADYFGVARSQNAHLMGGTTQGNEPIWHMLQTDQEETVVEALKNAPSGPALMAAMADVGGFRFNTPYSRPSGTNGNAFLTPKVENNTSIDFHEANPDIWVRTVTDTTSGGSRQYVSNFYYGGGGVSTDGGLTWRAFGEISNHSIASGAAGWETWDLSAYVSQQRARNPNKVITLVVMSDRVLPFFSPTVLEFFSKDAPDPNTSLRPKLVINGTTELSPVVDTYVASAAPNTNYGTLATLRGSVSRQIYLKFDLSTAPAITTASLQLYRTAASTGTTYMAGVHTCNDALWNETTLTWTNRPKVASDAAYGNPELTISFRTESGVDLSGGRAVISAIDPNRIVWMPFFAADAMSPHYSTDGGATWNPCSGLPANITRLKGRSLPSYTIHQVTADRVTGHFYMVHLNSGGGNHTAYRSDDGASWTSAGTISAGTNNEYRAQIVAAPAASDLWFCDDGVDNPNAGGLWRSTNGGTDWLKIKNRTITGVRQVSFGKSASGSGYSVFILGNYAGVKGIYRSDDQGATWIAYNDLPSISNVESLAGDRQNHGGVFIGTGGRGIFHAPTP
jgi:hypothetical protein